MNKSYSILVLFLLLLGGVSAQEKLDPSTEKAVIVIVEMGQRLAGVQAFSFRSDSTFDDLRSSQYVEFSQSTVVRADRTRGFRMDTRGDLMNSSGFFDGSSFVMYDWDKKLYAATPFKGTLHDLTDHAAEKLGIVLPAAELLRKDPGEAFLEDVDTLFYVGRNEVDGARCHHVAARNKNGLEWELWVDDGTLLPRKIVVRDPGQPGTPRSVAVLSDWKLGQDIPEAVFHFLIPDGAAQIEYRLPEKGQK